MIATAFGHLAVVELLIQKGAHIGARDPEGNTAVSWAIKNRNLTMIRLLLDHDPRLCSENGAYPELLSAVKEDQHEIIKLMVERGLNPDSKLERESADDSKHPGSLLTWAAARGHKTLVQLLISSGATIGLQDDIGWTPLTRAALSGQESIIRLLIEHGANINFPHNNMYTPLQIAAGCGNKAVVDLLIESGADINHRGLASRTPLATAARAGQDALLKMLIEKGAYIEEEDYVGRTPLIQAAERGHEAVVRILLDHGANRKASDDIGRTALIRAIQSGHLKIAKLLAEYSTDPGHQAGKRTYLL